MNRIVGITGMNVAGKGAVAEILKRKGFSHYSATEFILNEIKRLGMPQNRDSLIVVGNKLREQYGSGYVIEELMKEARQKGGDGVVESIRTVGEVESLKKAGGILLAVCADQKLRFERISKRGGIKDGVEWEKFISQEKTELESNDPNKQNLIACQKLADYTVYNNGTLEELEVEVNKFLKIYEN